MRKLFNLTGHDITIVTEKGEKITIPSNGIVWVKTITREEHIHGLNFPLVKREVTDLTGDTHLLGYADVVIVSEEVASYLEEYSNYVYVLTVGEPVKEKNPDGSVTIKGVKNLVVH